MIKLNDNNIFVAEIKQILKDFNLPQCLIGNEILLENNHYIKDYGIYLYKNNKEKRVSVYNYGEKYLNITSNLRIDNQVYDRYTHRYLGNYLRFLRDYKGIDLMSMYNCFDGEAFKGQFKVNNVIFGNNGKNITYKIPITKKALTIKFFSDNLVNMCIYVDSNETYTRKNTENEDVQIAYKQTIAEKTFLNKKTNQIFTYDIINKLWGSAESARMTVSSVFTNDEKNFINRNFNKLFLLLNVNKVTEDSIVVLEGSNFIDNQTSFYNNKDYIHFAVYPQLLSLENSKGNYLIGDRLIEYLTHNAICPLSGLADINRMHSVIKDNPHSFPFRDEEKYKYGYWTEIDSKNIKYFIKKNAYKLSNIYDLLGYVDKDVEQLIKEKIDNAPTSKITSAGNNYVQ